MIIITEKQNCCGCTACYNICPVSAIEMKADQEGFLYPVVDENKCINCGLCNKVCPIENKPKIEKENTLGFIVRNVDLKVVEESTSGGAFSVFANKILDDNGIVYGTGYDDNMRVVCKKAYKKDELSEMRGSKFVQSNLNDTYSEIRDYLKDKKRILFTGTPCQVAGLVNYLGSKPDNLVCIDFVCRGVPSPGLWENYVKMMEEKYHSKIIGARFKHKTYGYHATTMRIEFENGKVWYGSGRIDPMMKAFVNEMSSRPSCGHCHFKGIERISDITIFDCYEYSQITGKYDDDKGYSSIFIHSNLGKELFDNVVENFVATEVSVNSLVTKNGIMVCNSAKPNEKRTEFYKVASKYPIDVAMKKVNPITKTDILIEKSKQFLFKTGLIKIAKKLKNEKVIVNNN